jgi:hypothetical protein
MSAHTIGGLLKKRGELLDELQALRERAAVLQNDMASLDRVLEIFGYEGDLQSTTPRSNRVVLFYRNELRHYLLGELAKSNAPLSSRELAERIVTIEGKDRFDKRLMCDIVKRVGKALKLLRERGSVRGGKDHATGRYVWSAIKPPLHASANSR